MNFNFASIQKRTIVCLLRIFLNSRYNQALADYASAVGLKDKEVAPFWLRYAGVLFEAGRDSEALAVARRVKAKFSGEAEVNIALAALLAGAASAGAGTVATGSSAAGGPAAEAATLYQALPPIQRKRYWVRRRAPL